MKNRKYDGVPYVIPMSEAVEEAEERLYEEDDVEDCILLHFGERDDDPPPAA